MTTFLEILLFEGVAEVAEVAGSRVVWEAGRVSCSESVSVQLSEPEPDTVGRGTIFWSDDPGPVCAETPLAAPWCPVAPVTLDGGVELLEDTWRSRPTKVFAVEAGLVPLVLN
jgi:hypothetical protein